MADSKLAFSMHRGGGPSPASLVDDWAGFVEACRGGYQWPIEEYDNEIGVRDRIEALAESPAGLDPHLQARVRELDRAFESLLQTAPAIRAQYDRWWRRGILRAAGAEYAADIRNQYGFDVRPVE